MRILTYFLVEFNSEFHLFAFSQIGETFFNQKKCHLSAFLQIGDTDRAGACAFGWCFRDFAAGA